MPVIGNALAVIIGNAYDGGMNAIQAAIKAAGGQTALAAALGLKQPTVSEWARGERAVPPDRCPDIERASAGRVTCQELRSDVNWIRVHDPDWPHPEGRPCIDVARPTAQAA